MWTRCASRTTSHTSTPMVRRESFILQHVVDAFCARAGYRISAVRPAHRGRYRAIFPTGRAHGAATPAPGEDRGARCGPIDPRLRLSPRRSCRRSSAHFDDFGKRVALTPERALQSVLRLQHAQLPCHGRVHRLDVRVPRNAALESAALDRAERARAWSTSTCPHPGHQREKVGAVDELQVAHLRTL